MEAQSEPGSGVELNLRSLHRAGQTVASGATTQFSGRGLIALPSSSLNAVGCGRQPALPAAERIEAAAAATFTPLAATLSTALATVAAVLSPTASPSPSMDWWDLLLLLSASPAANSPTRSAVVTSKPPASPLSPLLPRTSAAAPKSSRASGAPTDARSW